MPNLHQEAQKIGAMMSWTKVVHCLLRHVVRPSLVPEIFGSLLAASSALSCSNEDRSICRRIVHFCTWRAFMTLVKLRVKTRGSMAAQGGFFVSNSRNRITCNRGDSSWNAGVDVKACGLSDGPGQLTHVLARLIASWEQSHADELQRLQVDKVRVVFLPAIVDGAAGRFVAACCVRGHEHGSAGAVAEGRSKWSQDSDGVGGFKAALICRGGRVTAGCGDLTATCKNRIVAVRCTCSMRSLLCAPVLQEHRHIAGAALRGNKHARRLTRSTEYTCEFARIVSSVKKQGAHRALLESCRGQSGRCQDEASR